jgi:hypothetical protein
VAPKNYYDLPEIPPNGTSDEIKRAFRQQIARYHPDKVQHLGQEFQNMAADRAAELTEASHPLGRGAPGRIRSGSRRGGRTGVHRRAGPCAGRRK